MELRLLFIVIFIVSLYSGVIALIFLDWTGEREKVFLLGITKSWLHYFFQPPVWSNVTKFMSKCGQVIHTNV